MGLDLSFLARISRGTGSRFTWYLICRTAVVTFLVGGAAFFYIKGANPKYAIQPLFILIIISYLSALVSALILKYFGYSKHFAEIQIVWDLIFVTALILLTGGFESVFSFVYLLIIVSTSFILNRRSTLLAAASATILFGGVLDLQYFGYLETINLYRTGSDSSFFSVVFVHSVAFFLTAALSGTLAERLRRSEALLKEKSIDYADLEKMNRTILSHISSGLLLVGPVGRIRSFNKAAEDITGFDLVTVYNQPAIDFFPGFAPSLHAGSEPVRRSECSFVDSSGNTLVFGYATTPAFGNRGEFLGTLVTFQDLTQLKKTEEDLKRADRLAAVGRLSAGMAHEIRNPLTSISGSVQMLMENKNIDPEDLGLMKIVVNEADRLNKLLTDFLDFAKPKVPNKKSINIQGVLLELHSMLVSDERFEDISITISPQDDPIYVSLDRDMFFQILWDLAVNAMEALEGQGRLCFSVKTNQQQQTCVIIEDSGPGVPENIKNKMFEPFFSTKDSGTGLGLASVYAVMDMHEGKVIIERSALGGAQFILCFS